MDIIITRRFFFKLNCLVENGLSVFGLVNVKSGRVERVVWVSDEARAVFSTPLMGQLGGTVVSIITTLFRSPI